MEPGTLIHEYLMLGLRFDRVEEGYVDSFTGDPALKHAVEAETRPDPADLARQAERLLTELPAGLDDTRAAFVGAHLRALACAGHKFAGQEVGFVDEVEAYFDVRITRGDPERYRQALAAEEWQQLDPILRLQRRLGVDGAELEQAAREEVEAAVRFARESAFPATELAGDLVYAS